MNNKQRTLCTCFEIEVLVLCITTTSLGFSDTFKKYFVHRLVPSFESIPVAHPEHCM